jgi:hypothetical protein
VPTLFSLRMKASPKTAMCVASPRYRAKGRGGCQVEVENSKNKALSPSVSHEGKAGVVGAKPIPA